VTEVRWWEHERFAAASAARSAAAEMVAFEVLEPALRSRGAVSAQAWALCEDPRFAQEMRVLLSGAPARVLVVPSLAEALARIVSLEERAARLEARLPAAEETMG
jgi:hypothetical protein